MKKFGLPILPALLTAALSFYCAVGSANATLYELTNVVTTNGDYLTGSLTVDQTGSVSQYSL
jgi:hypothetical protein